MYISPDFPGERLILVSSRRTCRNPDLAAQRTFACYLEWHLRQKLAPMLFDDTDKAAAESAGASVAAPAQRSEAAIRKQTTGITPDGLPVHSFRTLLGDLATLMRDTIVTATASAVPLTVLARPTPVQRRAYELLEIALQPVTVALNCRLSLPFSVLRIWKQGSSA